MSDPSIAYLARELADLKRRVAASERGARLQYATVGISTAEDEDAPTIDLDVSGALFTGVEAGVDATAAKETAGRAARTYRQPNPPAPTDQPDGIIPEGSRWTDTDSDGLEYRFEGGVWVQMPVGQGALTAALVAQITRRFDTTADRDALIPFPVDGMSAYVGETGLTYDYSAGQWVPRLQFIRKGSDQSAADTTMVADAQLMAVLVPGWYRIEALLHLRGNAAADVRVAWSYSGTVATGDSRLCLGPAATTSNGASTVMRSTGNNYATAVEYGVVDAASDVAVREDLLFRVTTGGTLQLWFAESVSATGSVVMGAQSRMFITKVA